jgi:hypothetical protein
MFRLELQALPQSSNKMDPGNQGVAAVGQEVLLQVLGNVFKTMEKVIEIYLYRNFLF